MSVNIILMLLVIVVAVGAMVSLTRGKQATGKYRKRSLMTDNESEFLGRLVHALPDHYIFPQVGMSAIIEPQSTDRKRAHSDRLRIAQQRVDYLVCDKTCNVIAVVELDDRTHSRSKDALRDARLMDAGVPTVRFQSRQKPTVADIRLALFPATPASPLPVGKSATPA